MTKPKQPDICSDCLKWDDGNCEVFLFVRELHGPKEPLSDCPHKVTSPKADLSTDTTADLIPDAVLSGKE